MISKTVKYEDFDGNEVETKFWFHLDKDELNRLNFGSGEIQLVDAIQVMGNSNTDIVMMLDLLKSIMSKAVGVRIEGGKYFDKEDKSAYRELMMTDAYAELVATLLEDPKVANDFIVGLMPGAQQKVIKNEIGDDLSNLSADEMRAKLKALEEKQKKEASLKAVQSSN